MPSDGPFRGRPWRRLAAILALAASLGGGGAAASAADLEVGRPAPSLTLHTLDGSTIDTPSLRGKVVIVAFWATWCDPCREELPLLSAYAAEHAAQGLEVLAFSLDGPGNLEAVREVTAGLNFPVGLLGGNRAGDYGRIWRLPVSFVIDRAGILRYDGWDADGDPWTRASLDRVVTPLL
jgi:peroxiredoxin